MATTTTNYGFDVPTSSDLVKNGATQIALLGQDLDTFLFRPFTRNVVLNSSFNVWQRGTSITTNTSYSADRWYYFSGSNNATISRQATSDTTNLPFIQYCARVQRNSGSAAVGAISISQSMESINSIPFAGKLVTFSFYARAGANYSGGSSLITQVRSGTGTDQNLQSGYTGSSSFISNSQALTTTWTRYTYTGTMPATGTEMGIYCEYTPTGTAGVNDYFEMTGVMIEAGNQASPYTPATPTYATELAACQRYYYRATTPNYAYGTFGTGIGESTTAIQGIIPLPVTMRTSPTAVDYSSNLRVSDASASTAVSSLTLDTSKTSLGLAYLNLAFASGITQYRNYFIQASNSTSSYIGVTAEL